MDTTEFFVLQRMPEASARAACENRDSLPPPGYCRANAETKALRDESTGDPTTLRTIHRTQRKVSASRSAAIVSTHCGFIKFLRPPSYTSTLDAGPTIWNLQQPRMNRRLLPTTISSTTYLQKTPTSTNTIILFSLQQQKTNHITYNIASGPWRSHLLYDQ